MLTNSKTIVVAFTWAAMTIPAIAQQKEPSIFVGAQLRGGFLDVDSGIRDSIRDIQQELKPDPTRRDAPSFRLAQTSDAATLVLIVLARGIVTNGSIGFGSSAAGTGFGFVAPNTVPTLTTILKIGDYERRMQSEGGTWRAAAKVVVQDVAAWWEANLGAVQKGQ